MPDDELPAAEPATESEPGEGAAAAGGAPIVNEPLAVDPLVGAAKLRPVPDLARIAVRRAKRAGERGRPSARVAARAGERSDLADELAAKRAPRPRRRRFWLLRLLPWLGLGLFAGSLAGLISSGPWSFPSFSTSVTPAFGSPTVVIDPGHGGTDSGAIAQGVVEKDLNLDVGLRVARVLEAAGFEVKLTRADDRFIPLETRVEIANALPAAIFVSIHFNDAQGEGRARMSRASGIETYYSGAKQIGPAGAASLWPSLFHGTKAAGDAAPPDAVRAGAVLADSIQRALIAQTAAEDRGIKEAGLYVTRRVRWPAVLVEGGFVSHPQEAHLLQDPAYRQKIANSIAEGIIQFIHLARPGVSPPPQA